MSELRNALEVALESMDSYSFDMTRGARSNSRKRRQRAFSRGCRELPHDSPGKTIHALDTLLKRYDSPEELRALLA